MSVPASSPLAQKKIDYFNLLRTLEKLAVVLYRKESAVITKLRLSHEPVRFEKGFATCKAWGRIFVFHALSQRVICQELWKPWQGGERVIKIPIKTLMERAGYKPKARIVDFFRVGKKRRMHPAVEFLIHFDRELAWMGPPKVTPEVCHK
jgi:hypothetical protein